MKKHGRGLLKIQASQYLRCVLRLLNFKGLSNCNVINFEDGVVIEGILCRFSGYIQPAVTVRKAAAHAV
jgi:hypothetical protein